MKIENDRLQNRGALAGIRVLDLSRLLPGPYCSMILADHGARVISVEDRRFQAAGHYVATVNRNKEHMTLDLKAPQGKKIFNRLVTESDVLIEGFRPGVVAKLGVDYASVRKIRPGIIYCSITGFGQNGPYRDRSGHDVNYLSLSGVLDLIGEKNHPPAIPGVQFSDMIAGMNGAIGIILALFERQKSGRGQYIDVAMTDSALAFMPVVKLMQAILGSDPVRGDGFLSHRYACYNTYQTADNRHIAIGALEPHFWRNLCTHLGLEEYIPLQFDDGQRKEIIGHLRGLFKQKTLKEWCLTLKDVDACWSPVLHYSEVLEDTHFKERAMVVDVPEEDDLAGRVLGVPIKLSRTPGGVRSKSPQFGADTRAVLKELGFDERKIDDLLAQGVI
jgi:crotonobetainyl-CoA:carnitine CoA-transferase CaiB-like acyl-CoA transferase